MTAFQFMDYDSVPVVSGLPSRFSGGNHKDECLDGLRERGLECWEGTEESLGRVDALLSEDVPLEAVLSGSHPALLERFATQSCG